jgi:hypothetical protein
VLLHFPVSGFSFADAGLFGPYAIAMDSPAEETPDAPPDVVSDSFLQSEIAELDELVANLLQISAELDPHLPPPVLFAKGVGRHVAVPAGQSYSPLLRARPSQALQVLANRGLANVPLRMRMQLLPSLE